jgi:hypothetical protein
VIGYKLDNQRLIPRRNKEVSSLFKIYTRSGDHLVLTDWQEGMTPKVVRQKNMVISPMGPGTKNDCAGKSQQQFT